MDTILDQIAQRTGLSKPTVKQVLGNRAHLYREQTRARIFLAAEELGYRRNGAARAVKTGRFGAVGLLTSRNVREATMPFDVQFGMQRALQDHDLHLSVGQLPAHGAPEAEMPRILREWSVDGLLISYTSDYPPAMIETIERYRIPSVWVNTKLPHDCVHPDDLAAGQLATEHLLRLGHRRIAFATFDHFRHYSFADRFAGYAAAMKGAGLPPMDLRMFMIAPELTPAPGCLRSAGKRAYFQRLLDRPDRPTAFVTYATDDTESLVSLAWKMGLEVPRDLSIICVSNSDSMGILDLTHLRLPGESLGQAAVDLLAEKLLDPATPIPPRAVAPCFVKGDTVGPVPVSDRP
ncbi:MAG TPA: LacI family DNA-binding transcriptional regulator [Tepidisphaeraceae bacterium]|jgi:LacI family transcriptional regulator|nr:LacI family DNA-binding transcriptional regulator [Tepidisphaeraceae bacterium]